MTKAKIADLSELNDREPTYALVANVDLVVIRYDNEVSVLYGRCHHRGALLANGYIDGENLICGVHYWDYRYDTGISEYQNTERLVKFNAWIEDNAVYVDEDEIREWEHQNPQPYHRDEYHGTYQDTHGTPEEPYVAQIQELARHGLSKVGHHGQTEAMGVLREDLPNWDALQFVVAQLHKTPHLDDEPIETELVIGPRAKKPLKLDIPIFVSDMSFGALSAEAKIALAKGAEMAGTGICSGEGGMLLAEAEANSRYFYELASARFGFSYDKLEHAQAFHFKGGQGAKTGTGGHLPGNKVTEEIAAVRGLQAGEPAISPARFPDWEHSTTSQNLRNSCGRRPTAFQSGLNSPHSTSRRTSKPRSTSVWITLFSTVEAAVLVPHRFYSEITSRSQRCQPWHAPGNILMKRGTEMSRLLLPAVYERQLILRKRWHSVQMVLQSRIPRCRRSAVLGCAHVIPTTVQSVLQHRRNICVLDSR